MKKENIPLILRRTALFVLLIFIGIQIWTYGPQFIIEETSKNPFSFTVFIFILGGLCGSILWHMALYIHESYIQNLNKLSQEKNFETILNNVNHISFNKRVGDLCFFAYDEYTLVYNLKKEQFHVFRNEECILTSIEIPDSSVVKSLKEHINSKFEEEINDCVVVGGITYSRNLFEPPPKKVTFDFEKAKQFFKALHKVDSNTQVENELDLDEILDKINKSGVTSLTKQELDFLKNHK